MTSQFLLLGTPCNPKLMLRITNGVTADLWSENMDRKWFLQLTYLCTTYAQTLTIRTGPPEESY